MQRVIPAVFALLALVAGAPCAIASEAPPAPPVAAQEVVAATPSGCCPAPNPCRRSRLEIQGHVALLTPDPEGLISVDSGTPNQARWDALDYDLAIGGRVAWTFPWRCWDVTVGGTFWGSWEDDANTTGTLNATQFPGGPPQISPVFDIPIHEEAALWGIDVSASQPWVCTPCFTSTWGLGLRYLRFREEADFTITQGAVVTTIAADVSSGLLAAEVMASGTWTLSRCWEFTARGGLFLGWMHRSGEINAPNQVPPVQGDTDDDDGLGFGGDAEIALRWHPSPCWSVSLGYGVLVMAEVARGHEALDFSNIATFDVGPLFSDDTLLVHRLFLGVGFEF